VYERLKEACMKKGLFGRIKVIFLALSALLMSSFAFAQADSVKAGIVVEPVAGLSPDFIRGADISMLGQIEECGGKFYNAQGKEDDLFNILKANGVNWIRLRVWNNPVNPRDVISNGKVVSKKGEPSGGGNNDLARTIKLAKRAKDAGFKLLIDFHYSDSWADPGKQVKPASWRQLTGKDLQKAVQDFTEDSLKQLIKAGARPDMVQIGNEVNGGMMWPDGKTWKGETEASVGGMDGFIGLLKAAAKGVRSAQGLMGDKMQIVVHLAAGGDNNAFRTMFDALTAARLDYDVIGMSFYPYWHGSLDALSANMNDCASRYRKEIIIAETAYAFCDKDGDDQGNNFQVYSDDKYSYLPTVQGQASWVRDLINTVSRTKNGLGAGIFYWEPAWIPVKGAGWRTGEGNNWENQAMFDFTGKVLPSLAVFNLVYGKGDMTNVWGGSARAAAAGSIKPYSFEPVKVESQAGSAPALPAAVKVIYTNDAARAESVTWDAHSWKNEKPDTTVTLGGKAGREAFPVTAEVFMSSHLNICSDPSFESGALGEWKLNGSSKACFVEKNKSNARTGDWTYKYWLGSAFKSILSRTFKGIPNGTYTYKIWAMGGGGENGIQIFAKDFGGKTMQTQVVNTGWKMWKEYTVTGINVTNNTLTVGIYLDTNAGNWGNFDDVEVYKQ
jgi:arabinogalactan endo-1,4-beta-galactosidase